MKPGCLKKLIVLALALALVGGCCTGSDGNKSFWNCLTQVGEYVGVLAEKVCNFSVAESEEAQLAVAFISNTVPIVGVVTGVPITQAQAETVLTTVAGAAQTGACVLLTDLQNALAFVDKLAAEYQNQFSYDVAKLVAKGLPVTNRYYHFPPDLSALRAKAKK